MPALGLETAPIPLIWTADFILGDKVDDKDTYFVGEFNCSCVGITQQLHLTSKVAEAAISICKEAKGGNNKCNKGKVWPMALFFWRIAKYCR